jgi:hypothetical protein
MGVPLGTLLAGATLVTVVGVDKIEGGKGTFVFIIGISTNGEVFGTKPSTGGINAVFVGSEASVGSVTGVLVKMGGNAALLPAIGSLVRTGMLGYASKMGIDPTGLVDVDVVGLGAESDGAKGKGIAADTGA